MSATTRSGMIFDIGIAVHTAYDDEGWIGVRLDGFGGEDSGLGDSELQTPFGFTSRPVDRGSDGVGCEVLYAHQGNSESFAWFGKDPRYTDKCPPLYQGSSAQWASNGSFHLLDTEKNTSMLYVPRGASAHSVTVGEASDGVDLIEFRHSSGALLYCTPSTGWVMRGVGNAFTTIDGDAFSINGDATVTSSLTVGGPAAMPAVNATTFSALVTAMVATLNSGASPPITPFELALCAALTALFNPATFPQAAGTKLFATL